MQVLVTGDRGRIGTVMMPMLSKEGHEVTGSGLTLGDLEGRYQRISLPSPGGSTVGSAPRHVLRQRMPSGRCHRRLKPARIPRGNPVQVSALS
jgi:hypothetical protein